MSIRSLVDNINEPKIMNMKSLVKSIALLSENNEYIVRIQTKSNKYIEYKFDTHEGAVLYYKDITNE